MNYFLLEMKRLCVVWLISGFFRVIGICFQTDFKVRFFNNIVLIPSGCFILAFLFSDTTK